MENVYTIWKTGYNVQTALSVERIAETEKACQFKVLSSEKVYTFWMPKRALSEDKNINSVLNLANWFKIEGFLAFLFDRYASHYPR